jgi:hypothetical protein
MVPFDSYQDRPGMFTKSVTLSEVAGAGCTACTTRTGALYMPYIRAGHRGKRTDEGKSQGLSLVDSTVRHAHCNKYYYNIEFQILYAYMLLIY